MVTMKDVAGEVGLSHTTVSLVLNGRQPPNGHIPEETRRRVQEAAQRLGYRRNEVARSMVTGSSRVLGFLAGAPQDEYAARVLAGALEEAESSGHFVQVLRFQEGKVNRELIQRCVESRLAGLMVLSVNEGMLDYLRQEMTRYHIPVANLGSNFPDAWGMRVMCDDVQGCHLAVEHLAGLGHRRIALLLSGAGLRLPEVREAGFRRAMREFALPVEKNAVRKGDWSDTARLENVLRDWMSCSRPPTAIFCGINDSDAAFVLRAASLIGWRVPVELSVVGYTDSSIARMLNPPLTTVAQPFEEMGRRAVRRLIQTVGQRQARNFDHDAAPYIAAPEVLFNTLTVRDSTARENPKGGGSRHSLAWMKEQPCRE